mmetsp:Transcript_17041/g.43509  ORF Transcript_17041/g.43509 Transcript_17041/m.43509 type:complete len:360 (+) Transcript_17041:58-1137(+)
MATTGAEMTLEERFALCRSVGEECIQEEELRALLSAKPNPVCYDGFEPSGRMHIAQGVQKAMNVNKLTKSGCKFVFWVADWFAMLNNKMGGDLKKIRVVGEYFVEIWKSLGMDMSNVEFKWASEEITKHGDVYWPLVMDIARLNTVTRVLRCGPIMGRNDEGEDLPASQIMYPCMQAADIFFLKADICQLGMDQRKVNMLAREYCETCKPKRKYKPIILSHHMLSGLKEGQTKMSKSDPKSAIFMEDEEQSVREKIKGAFCPVGQVEGNPCMDYMKHIVFPKLGTVLIKRSADNGGDKEYTSYEEMAADYSSQALHPGDLKPALTAALNEILQPVRDHFNNDPKAKELLEKVKRWRATR